MDRLKLRSRAAPYGDFVYVTGPHEYWGKRPMYAKLLQPGTSDELLPHLEDARIVRVRQGLLVAGTEVIAWASKSKGTRYRQTWLCTQQRIQPDAWPEPPRDLTARGFDRADDDAE